MQVILAEGMPPRGEVAEGEKRVVPVGLTSRGRGLREAHPVMSAIGRGYTRPGRGHRSGGEPPAGACQRWVWVVGRPHPHFVADSS